MLPFFFLLTCSLAAAAEAKPAADTSGEDSAVAKAWAELTKKDLRFIRDTLKDNHPGAIDPFDDGFKLWLEKGYNEALVRAQRVESFDGLFFAEQNYVNGFRDGHLSTSFAVKRAAYRWPGFVVGTRGRDYTVVESSEKQLPKGSRLIACDGKNIQTQLDDRIIPNLGNPLIEATHAAVVPFLLVDRADPFSERIKGCEFETKSNQRVTVPLNWREIDRDTFEAKARRAAARTDRSNHFALRRLGKNGYWIELPTFWPENEELQSANALLAKLKKQIKPIREAKFVVLDVRGNTGGSSHWGHEIATILWGNERVAEFDQRTNALTSVDWRVSPKNAEYLNDMVAQLKENFGADAEITKNFEVVDAGLSQALRSKQPYYREPKPVAPKLLSRINPPRLAAKVVLLTDAACFSACLDFADIVLTMPGVVHAGQTTSADTVYMEARSVNLPSGLGKLHLPIKVYRDRARISNQAYVPTQTWDGDIADTLRLEKWIDRSFPKF